MPSNFFEDSTYEQHVRLRLSAKSASQPASQPAVFFSHKNQPAVLSVSQISPSEQAGTLVKL
jgi:hypothetical protein